ncbi:MAG: glycosyltransferase family 2 protein, partial [Methanogenium sp.]
MKLKIKEEDWSVKNYKIAVVTSFYNTAKYVESMYESIINQSYNHWNWYICDDFSTDNTKELLKENATRDNRITFIDIPSKKYAFWNPQKLAWPDSDIIVNTDSDDYMLPFALEEINYYFNYFSNILAMSFSSMKYKEILPLFDDKTLGLSNNFMEVLYFSEIKNYLSGMENLSPLSPNVFGSNITWRNIDIEFPEHSDTPWASSNDAQWNIILEEYGKVMNVPRILKLVRCRDCSENFTKWSKNGEIILINEGRKRRKEKNLIVEYPKESFDNIKKVGESTYYSTFNFTLNTSLSFFEFDLTDEEKEKVRKLFNTNKVSFDLFGSDYTFVHIDIGTYVDDFIKKYNFYIEKVQASELVFYISNRNMNFDIGHILDFIKTKTNDIVYESGDNRVAIVHNCKDLSTICIQKPYKIKLVHTLCRPNDKREVESVLSLFELMNYGINYVQHVNPPFQGEIPENRPSRNPISKAHYGCYSSFQRAIKEEFTDDVDFLLFCECDCILETDAKTFSDVLYKTCDIIKQEKIDYFSFGDNTHAGTKELWSEVIRKIPNVDWMYITNKIALAHCLLFPKESRDKLIDMFDNYSHWGTTDNLL